jgi:hypothetical protein
MDIFADTSEYYEYIWDAIIDTATQRNWQDDTRDKMAQTVTNSLEKHVKFEIWTQEQREQWYYYTLWLRMCKHPSSSSSNGSIANAF